MEYEIIQEKVIPEQISYKSRGKYRTPAYNWLNSEAKTLKLICKDQYEKKCCYNSLRQLKKERDYDYTIYLERGTYNIYLVRA